MSFGNINLYPFPAVQYIPLPVTTVEQGFISGSDARLQKSQLFPGDKATLQRDALRHDLGISHMNPVDPDSYPILALNLEIMDIKYRGFYLTMTGRLTPGCYQFCSIPKRYFYKKNLFFELYDAASAECLATATALLS